MAGRHSDKYARQRCRETLSADSRVTWEFARRTAQDHRDNPEIARPQLT